MPVEEIIERIENDVQNKIKSIYERGKEREEKVKEKIEKEKEKRLKEIRKDKEREIKTMKNRIISQAKLKKKKRLLQVREKMLEKVFETAKTELKEMPPSEYEGYLRMAIGRSAEALDGDVLIKTTPESEEMVKELARKIDPSLKVESGLETSGGIKAESSKGATLDLTFEANLERKKKELRKEIADILFPEE